MFGLSSGALVVLKTALVTSVVQKAALYEPPFSINGSVPTDWGPDYESQIERGKLAIATVTALKGIGTEPLFGKLPRFVLIPLWL